MRSLAVITKVICSIWTWDAHICCWESTDGWFFPAHQKQGHLSLLFVIPLPTSGLSAEQLTDRKKSFTFKSLIKYLMGREITTLNAPILMKAVKMFLLTFCRWQICILFPCSLLSSSSFPSPPPLHMKWSHMRQEKTVNPCLNYNLTFHPDFTPSEFCFILQGQSRDSLFALYFSLAPFLSPLLSFSVGDILYFFTFFHIWTLAILYLFPLPFGPFVLISFHSFLHPVFFSLLTILLFLQQLFCPHGTVAHME